MSGTLYQHTGLQWTLAAIPTKQVVFEQLAHQHDNCQIPIVSDCFKNSLCHSVIRLHHPETCFHDHGTEFARSSFSSQISCMVSMPQPRFAISLSFPEVLWRSMDTGIRVAAYNCHPELTLPLTYFSIASKFYTKESCILHQNNLGQEEMHQHERSPF